MSEIRWTARVQVNLLPASSGRKDPCFGMQHRKHFESRDILFFILLALTTHLRVLASSVRDITGQI